MKKNTLLILILLSTVLMFTRCSSDSTKEDKPTVSNSTMPSYIPTDGLVGYWPFNGNANDMSQNGNNGTVYGAKLIPDRLGNANSAYNFNGVSDYIRINNVLLPNTPNSYTISLWYKSSSFSLTNGNAPQLISDRSTGLSSYKYAINIDPTNKNRLAGTIFNGSGLTGNTAYKDNIVADNSWHHVVFIYDKSVSTIYLYIDNILVNQTSNVTHWSTKSDPTNIGYWDGFVGASGFFNGNIDDIAIWNRSLTQTEITNLYIATPSYVSTDGLVGWWPFNGNANDVSKNGNNGTVNGATLTSDRFGNDNSAYGFDGVSNYIRINNVLLPNTSNSYTISLWYKSFNFSLTNGNAPQLISDRSTGLSSYKYAINIDPTNKNRLAGTIFNGSGLTGDTAYKDNIVADNNWHHVVFIYDKSVSTIYLYIDNILVNQMSNVTHWSSKPNPTNIGYWDGFVGASGFFNGNIDDIGVWNRVLAQTEINNLYKANK